MFIFGSIDSVFAELNVSQIKQNILSFVLLNRPHQRFRSPSQSSVEQLKLHIAFVNSDRNDQSQRGEEFEEQHRDNQAPSYRDRLGAHVGPPPVRRYPR